MWVRTVVGLALNRGWGKGWVKTGVTVGLEQRVRVG